MLAEETTSGRTGRSVDSSLERMQVRLSGLVDGDRYALTCNGRRVPLTPVQTRGEAIAGIRYRARKLSATLHPTVPVHTPLTFKLIDRWSGSVALRCTYFAGPPDGRVHTTRPIDQGEARARRQERFVVQSVPPGTATLPAEEPNPAFPMTLDLRWLVRGAAKEEAS